MKLLALFYQNPAGYLTSVLLLIASIVSFTIGNKDTAYIFLFACIFIVVANTLYSVLSFKRTIKYRCSRMHDIS